MKLPEGVLSHVHPSKLKIVFLIEKWWFYWSKMRFSREKLTVCGLILSALAFLYFGLSTVWLQVQIKHLRLERNYLDHQIGAKKIELKALRSASSTSKVLKQNFESNDSEVSLPVSQVILILLDQIIWFWYRLVKHNFSIWVRFGQHRSFEIKLKYLIM